MELLKKAAALLPARLQEELKRLHFARQIRKDTFVTWEPEYKILDTLVNPGDWVIDIGANVGHYTKRLSDLVGNDGRVLAFEPVPATFDLLAANVQRFNYKNVSLMNAAASDKFETVGITMPSFSSGLANFYEAHISEGGDLSVLALPVDSLSINRPISLIKIDAEGHEEFVLKGMRGLIEKYKPTLIVETHSERIISDLEKMGYQHEKLPGSPNILFR